MKSWLPLLALLLFFPSSLRGQSNCSSITYQVASSSTTSKWGCIGIPGIGYSTTWNYAVSGYNTQSNLTYCTRNVSLTATGFCQGVAFTAQIIDCTPKYDFNITIASTPTGSNKIVFTAIDNTLAGSSCVKSNGATVTAYCMGQACQSSSCPYPVGSPPYCGAGYEAQWDSSACYWKCIQTGYSPILIDVSGQGFQLTSADNGVLFDISGTGQPKQMGWTAPGADDAFLCLPDVDGRCDDGKDLFGNFTPQPPSDTPNGFAALAVYDDPKSGGNGDGVIDARDAIFASLRLWIDENHDGISQPGEMHTLASLGVNSISLKYREDDKIDQYGNLFRYHAQVNPGGPTSTGRVAYDVFFVSPAPSPTTTTKNLLNPEGNKCTVPVQVKGGMLSTTGTLR
jgi:hypothetical protein